MAITPKSKMVAILLKKIFLDIKLIHEVIYFSGIYKLTGHFILVLDSRALLILLNIEYCSSMELIAISTIETPI